MRLVQSVLVVLVLALFAASQSLAYGQYGRSNSTSAMVGSYGDGLGGIFAFSIPLNLSGLARSGLGVVAEGQLGMGLGENDLQMAALAGGKLIFPINRGTDLYGGLGFGSSVLPNTESGLGGQVGLNLAVSGSRVFFEAGAHPGNNNYLGVGLRF